MSGLIQRDLLLYFRKFTKVTYILEAVYFLFFLFIVKNKLGPITYLLLCAPINMSGLPATLKEMDTNYKGMMTARLLPYRKRDIVKGRFYSAFCCHIFYLVEMLLFALCHYLLWGVFSLSMYLQLFLGGWLIAVCLTTVNLLASFLSSLNATMIFYFISVIGLLAGYLLFLFFNNSFEFLIQLASLKRVWLFLIAGCFDVLILLGSYFISRKYFERNA